MVNVGQNWIASERITLLEFMLGLHGGAFCLALAWLLFRHFNVSWKNILAMPKLHTREARI
jgi:lipopolysaccharide export system permease protein